MKEMKLSLNMDTFDSSKLPQGGDVHCVASMLKVKSKTPILFVLTSNQRWFGELPEKLFAQVSVGGVGTAASDEEASVLLVEKLPELERSLFRWFAVYLQFFLCQQSRTCCCWSESHEWFFFCRLLDLLVEIALRKETNKMTPHNLAIIVGPIMVDMPKDKPFEGIALTAVRCFLKVV